MCTESHHWHHDYVRLAWDSGFSFNIHRIKTNFDWSSIGLLDVDRIVRDRDVAIVEKHMGTILNYSLDEEQTRILEPTFVKVFQLSQLSLQYLQFCKRYLDNTVVLLKKELGRYKEENSKLEDNVEELKNEIIELKKKVKELKHSVQTQPTENIVSTTFKCSACSKIFVNEEYLLAHFKRRHEIDENPFQTETDRLQLEIKELKERLNSTEKFIHSDPSIKFIHQKQESIPNNDAAIENVVHVDDLKYKFDHLKQYVEQELKILRNEQHYQEKYEKWFEMVFQRLDSSKNEPQEKEDVNGIDNNDRLNQKETSTQTVIENYKESETMTEDIVDVDSKENLRTKPVNLEEDIQKIKEDITIDTVSHLDQMQGVLEEKLSGGFEQIQIQMNSFWKKLSDIELEKKLNAVNTLQIGQPNNLKVLSVSSSITKGPIDSTSIKSGSSSETLEKSIAVKNQPVPAPRIVKRYSPVKTTKPNDNNITSQMRKTNVAMPKIVEDFQKISSEDTSSEDTIEIVKAPLEVTPAKKTKSDNIKDKTFTQPKFRSKYTRTFKKSGMEALSDSETDDEPNRHGNAKPQIKYSTSTLGQRSLTSLKQIMKDEVVMKGLNNELQEMINLRLKEIGISPYWTRIPEKSYKQAMRVVNHQTDLSRRKYSNFTQIREAILNILSEKVKKVYKNGKDNMESTKQKKERELIGKQPIMGKRVKQQQYAKYRSTSSVDVNSDDSPIKSKEAFTRGRERSITHFPPNVQKEKTTVVGVTPVKKKVLFDLETSGDTLKMDVIDNLQISQIQQNVRDDDRQLNFERIVTSSSPAKKQEFHASEDFFKAPVQKVNKKVEINDGGSITSLASSTLEAPKFKAEIVESRNQNVTKDDISDWDISDILT